MGTPCFFPLLAWLISFPNHKKDSFSSGSGMRHDSIAQAPTFEDQKLVGGTAWPGAEKPWPWSCWLPGRRYRRGIKSHLQSRCAGAPGSDKAMGISPYSGRSSFFWRERKRWRYLASFSAQLSRVVNLRFQPAFFFFCPPQRTRAGLRAMESLFRSA